LLFRHKNSRQIKFQIELGDLQNEKEQLSSFLQSKLKVTVNQAGNKLTVKSEKLSVQELHHVVTKFIYHRNLNSTHWASTEGTTVTINRFKGTAKKNEKHKKNEQHKKNTPSHQTAIQSWGL
jgi:phosphate starvation-inducible protein PhoH